MYKKRNHTTHAIINANYILLDLPYSIHCFGVHNSYSTVYGTINASY